MPVEAKPLFRPDVLRSRLAGFQLPDRVAAARSKLEHWAALIASRRIDNFNEQQILPDFLTDLDSDGFVAEVKRIRGKKSPLSASGLKSLRDEFARTIEPARTQAREALLLEHRLSDLVNEAYGLTPDEVALLWQTAPPRMPFSPA